MPVVGARLDRSRGSALLAYLGHVANQLGVSVGALLCVACKWAVGINTPSRATWRQGEPIWFRSLL